MSRQPLATWEMAEILIRSRKATAAEKERLRPLLATMTAKEGSQKIGWSSSLFIMQTWDRCYPREPVCPPYHGQSDYEFAIGKKK
jgi:hypothetical protein